jgi:hypothetical protein
MTRKQKNPETLIGIFVKKLNARLADDYRSLQAENKRLRERLGPHGLEVIEIDGAGHYVNRVVKAEIERLRRK